MPANLRTRREVSEAPAGRGGDSAMFDGHVLHHHEHRARERGLARLAQRTAGGPRSGSPTPTSSPSRASSSSSLAAMLNGASPITVAETFGDGFWDLADVHAPDGDGGADGVRRRHLPARRPDHRADRAYPHDPARLGGLRRAAVVPRLDGQLGSQPRLQRAARPRHRPAQRPAQPTTARSAPRRTSASAPSGRSVSRPRPPSCRRRPRRCRPSCSRSPACSTSAPRS